MPSTYTVNLGIEKPATGEQSGTWGDTVNDNSNIIDEAVNGVVTITLTSAGSSGSPNELAITNGASSTGRNKWIEFADGGDLSAAAYVQLVPNDAEKICFIRNSLSGSRSVFIFQGTYSTSNDLEIAAGTDVLVKFNGAGTGATVVNVYANLKVDALVVSGAVDAATVEFDSLSGTGSVAVTNILDEDNLASNSATVLATQQSIKAYVDAQVDTVDTLAETLAIGNTTSGTDIETTTTDKVQFRDAAIYINSSADGQLDIVADTEVQIATTTVDLNGALDVSGTVVVAGALTGSSTLQGTTITATTAFVPDAADGAALGTTSLEFSDLYLADGAVIGLGADQDVTLTHIADTGIRLNTNMQLQFYDASQFINAPSSTVLDINATDEVELNATLVDVNANLDVSGTLTQGGASQFNSTIIVGVDDTGYDVKLFGATSGAYMLWDESADDLKLVGAAGLTVAGDIDIDGTANLDVVDIDGAVNMATTALVTGVLTTTATQVATGGITSGSSILSDTDSTDSLGSTAVRWLKGWFDTLTAGTLTIGSGSVTDSSGAISFGNENLTTTGIVTAAGTSVFTNLDISGDIDVDGTTNLDVVDIDGAVNMATTALVTGVLTTTATQVATGGITSGSDIISDTDSTDSLGSTGVRWLKGWFDTLTAGTLTIGSGSVTDSSGAIDFGNENLTTTGTLASGSATITNSSSGALTTGLLLTNATATSANTAIALYLAPNAAAATRAASIVSEQTTSGNYADLTFNVANGDTPFEAMSIATTGAASFAADVTYADGADIITASAGTSNFRAGVNAGNSIASGGNYNVCVGDEAGTAITTGDNNVAVGFNSLVTDTLGSRSTALGYAALSAQNFTSATDSYNTAVGYNAGGAVTTGVNNTLIGGIAGDALTDADYNVAIGRSAVGADTLGNASVAVGYSALSVQNFTSATESHNTAVGFIAGNDVTTGVQNTLLGSGAGQNLTDADSNIAVGFNSLANDTLGSRATAVGRYALFYQNFTSATNSGNIAVGYYAGNAITTGGRNTIIGTNAGDALTDADDNVVVGYLALTADTLGSRSTAVGRYALNAQNFTSATNSHNTAVGFNSGQAVTTGINNTLIGGLAGDALTDADHNVAIGMNALSSDTLGSRSTAVGYGTLVLQNFTSATDAYNVAVGFQAGYELTTGFNNTLIGSLCHDNLTTGDLNVSVGYNNAPSAVGVDSEIVIGNSVTGAGTNTVRIGTAGGTATLGLDGSDTSWAAASDSRLKKDVAESTAGLEFINDLRPITFKWNAKNEVAEDLPQHDADSSDPIFGEGKAHHGFIAQEVKAVIDDHSDVLDGNNIWHEDPDGTQQLSQGNLVPMLVKAVQELSAKIAELESKPQCKCNGE